MVRSSTSEAGSTRRGPLGILLRVAIFVVAIPWLLLTLDSGAPFVWIFLLWGLLLLLGGVRRRRAGRGGFVLFNLGILLIAFGVVEAYQWRRGEDHPRFVGGDRKGYADRHAELGYAPKPNAAGRFRKEYRGELVYDETHHTNAKGLRVGPFDRVPYESELESSLLCFGGSTMYGDGIPDEAAVPYRLGELLSPGGVRAYNFAFSGWGTHQLVTGLDHGWLDKVAEPPIAAIYLLHPDHVRRVKGHAWWDPNGPRYVLRADGSVERDGRFSDRRVTWRGRLLSLLERSWTARQLIARVRESDRDPALLVGLVRAAAERIHARWPDCTFHVLVWDREPVRAGELAKAVEMPGIVVTLVRDIATDLHDQPDATIPYDGHPTPATTDRLARAIADHLLSGDAR